MSERWRWKGGGWTWTAGMFAVLCWIIWAASTAHYRHRGRAVDPAVHGRSDRLVHGGAARRSAGHRGLDASTRRGATGAHIAVRAIFLYAVGITYLQQTAWVMRFYGWLTRTERTYRSTTFEGLVNFRDLGGTPVDGGVIRPGVLLRSDSVVFRDRGGCGSAGRALGLRTVVDLRDTP